jgi:hypothetical protein
MKIEMMKQLMQEFAEKESMTAEEIKAVQQQSQELELRIQKCKAKLLLVSEDKVKIAEMMQRYSSQNNGQQEGGNAAGVTRPTTVVTPSKKETSIIPPFAEAEKQNDAFSNLPGLSPAPAPSSAPSLVLPN